jgi:tRNA/tmRNA/rRNA uracil-C5-methylase (TrmA/RlmC/RlmD family)
MKQKPGDVSKIEDGRADCAAILDPPRLGLGDDFSGIASSLEKLGVKVLVTVGCDPDAWSRDLSRWVKRGWKFERMMVIDLFPQTAHVESVGFLTRIS